MHIKTPTWDNCVKAAANTIKLDCLADYKLIIQPHQRAYAWKQNDVTSFFKDLEDVVDAASIDYRPSHYFGTIFAAQNNEDYVIVDGQQRITTAFLCLKCILEKTDEERVRHDVRRILFSHVSKEEIRLESNNINRDTFRNIICDHEYTPDEPDPSNEKLIKAYEELNRCVGEYKKKGKSLYDLFDALRNFTIIFINGSISDVHTIFSLINTRGVKLQKSDVIKSYLFSKSESTKDVENDKKWATFYKNVTSKKKGNFDNLDKFILHVLNIRCKPERSAMIRPNDMYDEIRNKIEKNGMTAESWIEEFKQWARIFVELRTGTKIDLGPYSPKYLELIKDINSELIYRVLMAGYALLKRYEREAGDKFIEQKNKFKELIPLCLKYHLRVKTLAGDSPESMKALTYVARDIYSGGVIDIKIIDKKLNAHKNDEIIIKKINGLKYKDASVVKTLLFLLETKSPAFQSKNVVDIDHILPQKYKKICDYVHDLGNLTLLEEKLNNTVKDKLLSQKKGTYLNSIFSETKNLARRNKLKIGMDSEKEIEMEEKRIRERTKELSNRIAKLLQ